MKNLYIEESYRVRQSIDMKLNWKNGTHNHLRKMVTHTCKRDGCLNNFNTTPSDPKKYCSQRCSATVNNSGRNCHPVKPLRFCLNCKCILIDMSKIKYCSVRCQYDFQHTQWIEQWKNGQVMGSIGITVRNISAYLKNYLHEKYNNKCARCGWHEIHPITGLVPVEIEHIDGNSENNTEENLILLCPNCHSLTQFYKNLNKGRGRKWRMEKYIKNVKK